MKNIEMKYVIKSSGDEEKFDKNKIIRTIIKAGGTKDTAKQVAQKIEKNAKNGIKTIKILKDVLKLLKNQKRVAIRYDLKRAIMNLGPAGYVFEEYFSKILEEYGYKTLTNEILKGKNIDQEVDIIAVKKKIAMVECKYHNRLGNHTDTKEVMYTYARFLDLNSRKKKFDYPWLVTNTQCTYSAQNYSKGVGLKITSWSYPEKENLQMLIEQKKLYPITIIPSLNKFTKELFHDNKIIMINQLFEKTPQEISNETGINLKKLNKIISEARELK
jgi:hypothetical protein